MSKLDDSPMELCQNMVLPPISAKVSSNSQNTAWPKPITFNQAVDLRKVLLGTPLPISKEWKNTGFVFYDESAPTPWGLQTSLCGARGVVMCVQSWIIKNMFFKNKDLVSAAMDGKIVSLADHARRLNRTKILMECLSEMIWRAGDKRSCKICITGTKVHVRNTTYRGDGITEKIDIYKFDSYPELLKFMSNNSREWRGSGGVLLFVYSIIMTRGTKNILKDAGTPEDGKWVQLLTDWEEVTCALINLLLTGKAALYMHNGLKFYDNSGKTLDCPQQGIDERSDIGVLAYNDERRIEIGSMLKTPKYPIWIASANRQIGVLFSLKPELMNHWRAEHFFDLHHYTGLLERSKNYSKLLVDTRLDRYDKTRQDRHDRRRRVPAIEECILTKWANAVIETK
ncbi:DgyrCDS3129 [Dimorphilus gyrociliatus]|nr:DgyrCDS3129 [Dimorphilus gyrociliatus]